MNQLVMSWLNAPYLWGGKSIWGIDCSGFVQVVFQMHGMDLSRDAYQQAELGETVEFNDLIQAGDLAFFSKGDDRISHVGICLNKEQIQIVNKSHINAMSHDTESYLTALSEVLVGGDKSVSDLERELSNHKDFLQVYRPLTEFCK